jgi:hypothetical protein
MNPTRIPLEAQRRPSFFDEPSKLQPTSCPEDIEGGGWEELFPTDWGISSKASKISVTSNWMQFFYEWSEPETDPSLEREFNIRAERWEKETAIHSSPTPTYLHRDYYAIIGMGISNPNAVIPLILKRIPNTGADWFFALETIIEENPAKDAVDFERALEAWHNWADKNLPMEPHALPTA